MLKQCVVSLLLASTVWYPLMAERNLSYLELSCQTFEQMAPVLDSLQAAGLNMMHVFPPNALIAETGSLDLSTVLQKPAVRLVLARSSGSRQETANPLNEMAFEVWRYVTDPAKAKETLLIRESPYRTHISSDLYFSVDEGKRSCYSFGEKGGQLFVECVRLISSFYCPIKLQGHGA